MTGFGASGEYDRDVAVAISSAGGMPKGDGARTVEVPNDVAERAYGLRVENLAGLSRARHVDESAARDCDVVPFGRVDAGRKRLALTVPRVEQDREVGFGLVGPLAALGDLFEAVLGEVEIAVQQSRRDAHAHLAFAYRLQRLKSSAGECSGDDAGEGDEQLRHEGSLLASVILAAATELARRRCSAPGPATGGRA